MGKQIEIVQSGDDEQELCRAVLGREHFLVVPWVQKSPLFEPCDLGECDANMQLFFLARDADLVLSQVQESGRRPGEYHVSWPTSRGLVIEWSRTRHKEGAARAGRFYLDTVQDGVTESTKFMELTMNSIRRRITKTYPMRSDERYPMYVGPHMWELVQARQARILYPNKSEVPLVPNDRR